MSDPRRLSLVIPDLTGGGAERVFVTLANEFAARGHAVDVVVAAGGPYEAEIGADVRLVKLGGGRLAFAVPRLVPYLRRTRPAAILSTLTHANLACVLARIAARTGTRLVLREANQLSTTIRARDSVKYRVMGRLVRALYPRADALVAVSEGVARDLAGFVGEAAGRVRVIYNPVVTETLLERSRESVDHPWLAPGSPPLVLGVGNLKPQKDFATLIRAFHEADGSGEGRLLVLGEGPERPALERLVSDLGLTSRVALPGWVPNPFSFMRGASLFVLSSRYEGLPNALIQALACGCPVVSTDCESGPREILEDGAHGRLVPVGDPPALALAIRESLQRPADREASTRRGCSFSARASVERYLSLLLPPDEPPASSNV